MRFKERQSFKFRFGGCLFQRLSCPLSSIHGNRPIFCFLVFNTFKLSAAKGSEWDSLKCAIVSRFGRVDFRDELPSRPVRRRLRRIFGEAILENRSSFSTIPICCGEAFFAQIALKFC
jgi:hypothetical protein